MLIVFLHQLHDHMISLRVQLILLLVLLFFAVNGTIYSWRMETQGAVDTQLRAAVSRRYDGVETVRDAASAGYRVANEPTGTEFIAEGGFDWLWGGYWFSRPTTGSRGKWNGARCGRCWPTRSLGVAC